MSDIYTWAQAVTEVTLSLGNRSDIAARVPQWLNEAQYLLAKCDVELPLLEETVSTFVTVSGQSEYELTSSPFTSPSQLLGIRFVKNLTTGVGMWRFNWDDYRRLIQQAPGQPLRWTRKGYMLALDPQPNAVYTLRFDYRRRPDLATIEIDGEWQGALIDTATLIGARRLGMDEVATRARAGLPLAVLTEMQRPQTQEDWEMRWNEPSLVPGAGGPYSVSPSGTRW
jgi:hypothetical protein